MRVRSGRGFEPRRRQTLPLHAKLTQNLGERLALRFSPWLRVARTASVLMGTRLDPRSERPPESALPPPAPPAIERAEPVSERNSLDRDSVLPLELLAHPSVPAAAPAPQRKTPRPPRPRGVLLEIDDEFSSVAPPPLFALAPSDAPLVASTAPKAGDSRAHHAATRLASGALFIGLGVLAGWLLRGHSDRTAPLAGERTAAVGAALAAPAAAVRPVNGPPERNDFAGVDPPRPPPAADAPVNAPESTPARVEVPAVTIIARPNADEGGVDAEAHASSAAPDEAPDSAVLPGFDAEAAKQSITAAEARLSVCRGPSDPTGPATVVVRYAPSGRVTTATVESGPFVGTPAGGCIAATFRSTRVPPFAGEAVTVKRTVALR